MELTDLKIKKKNIIKNILKLSVEGGDSAAHIGGALSSVDILTVLFFLLISWFFWNPFKYKYKKNIYLIFKS